MSNIIAHIVFDDNNVLKSIEIVGDQTDYKPDLKTIVESGEKDFYIKISVKQCANVSMDCFSLSNCNMYQLDFDDFDFLNHVPIDKLLTTSADSKSGTLMFAESKSVKSNPQASNPVNSLHLSTEGADLNIHRFKKLIVDELNNIKKKVSSEPVPSEKKNILPQFKQLIVDELNKILKKEVTSEKKNILPQFKELILDELNKILKNVPSKEVSIKNVPSNVEELNKILPTIKSENLVVKNSTEKPAEKLIVQKNAIIDDKINYFIKTEAENKRKAEAENKRKAELEAKDSTISMQVPQHMIDSDFDNLKKMENNWSVFEQKMQFYSDIELKNKIKLDEKHKTKQGPQGYNDPIQGVPIYVDKNEWKKYIIKKDEKAAAEKAAAEKAAAEKAAVKAAADAENKKKADEEAENKKKEAEDAKYEKITNEINYNDGINYYFKDENGKYILQNGKILSVNGKLIAKLNLNGNLSINCSNCYIKKDDKKAADAKQKEKENLDKQKENYAKQGVISKAEVEENKKKAAAVKAAAVKAAADAAAEKAAAEKAAAEKAAAVKAAADAENKKKADEEAENKKKEAEDAKYEKITNKINYNDGINYYFKDENGTYIKKNGKILSVNGNLMAKLNLNGNPLINCSNCYIKKDDKPAADAKQKEKENLDKQKENYAKQGVKSRAEVEENKKKAAADAAAADAAAADAAAAVKAAAENKKKDEKAANIVLTDNPMRINS